MSDVDIKIADFGLSRMIDESTMMKTACGTYFYFFFYFEKQINFYSFSPTYVAPEVLRATGYGTEVDMWSIGVITYILLCGFPPFYGETISEMFEQIMSGSFDYPEEYWNNISKDAQDFINLLLKVDPKERLTASEALKHPWLTKELNDNGSIPNFGSKLTRRLGKTVINRKQESMSVACVEDFETN